MSQADCRVSHLERKKVTELTKDEVVDAVRAGGCEGFRVSLHHLLGQTRRLWAKFRGQPLISKRCSEAALNPLELGQTRWIADRGGYSSPSLVESLHPAASPAPPRIHHSGTAAVILRQMERTEPTDAWQRGHTVDPDFCRDYLSASW